MTYHKLVTENVSDKDIGYLTGFYIGDGYSHYSKKDRHYKTTFTLHSKELQALAYIEDILVSMGLNPFRVKDKRFECIMLSVNSKEFMDYIRGKKLEFFSSIIENREFCLGLVSGFIDAEGYVNNGEIQLTQKNKDTLDRIIIMVESLGIEKRKLWNEENYHSRNKVWRLRISTSFKYLRHNSVKVRNQYSGAKP